MRSQIFVIAFLPTLKILFVLLGWLKFLKDHLEEDSSIVAPSHILFRLPILKVYVSSLNGRTV